MAFLTSFNTSELTAQHNLASSSRITQLKDSIARTQEQLRNDKTLQRLANLTREYVDEAGINVCYLSARDLARKMLLQITRGEDAMNGNVRIWYGELDGFGLSHAIAYFETDQAEYYMDPIGFRPLGLEPGITVLQKRTQQAVTNKTARQMITPPLDRHSQQLYNEGRPIGNEMVKTQ